MGYGNEISHFHNTNPTIPEIHYTQLNINTTEITKLPLNRYLFTFDFLLLYVNYNTKC